MPPTRSTTQQWRAAIAASIISRRCRSPATPGSHTAIARRSRVAANLTWMSRLGMGPSLSVEAFTNAALRKRVCARLDQVLLTTPIVARGSEEVVLLEQRRHVAVPLAAEPAQQLLGARVAAIDQLAQRVEEAVLRHAGGIVRGTAHQARRRDLDHALGERAEIGLAERRLEALHRDGAAHRLALFRRPVLDEVPRRVERDLVVVDADPKRRQ